MKYVRFVLTLLVCLVFATAAAAQSGCQYITQGAQLTPAQWNFCFSQKQNTIGFIPIGPSGGIFTGPIITAPPTSQTTGFRLSPGVSPSSPIDGDLWATASALFARINGVTVNLSNLGTMAPQNANAVAITGGTITGMPNPTNNSDVATKSYVDATSQGLNIITQVRLATAAVLPNTPTYSNGASGVGATLTAGTNTTLTMDGTAVNLNDRVLVKNQASALQNGVYTLTTLGSGAAPWVLTRATDFDTAGEMIAGSYMFVTAGATNNGSSWVLQSTVTTVGTTAANFTQFSAAFSGVQSLGGQNGILTLGGSLTMGGTVLSDNVRTRLAGDTTFFIRSDGNNACSGLVNAGGSSGACAWADLQFALNTLNAFYDLDGHIATLSFGQTSAITWVPPASTGYQCSGPFVGARGPFSVSVLGTPTNSAQNTIIDSTPNGANQPAIQILNGCQITLQNLVIKSSLNAVVCIGPGYLQYGTIRWNGSSFVDIYAARHCQVEMIGDEIIQAIAGGNHVQGAHHGEWRNDCCVTFFTVGGNYGSTGTAFAYAEGLGSVVWTSIASFNLLGNTVTGQRCYAEGNGLVQFSNGGASFLPGNVNCTTATGGQVITNGGP